MHANLEILFDVLSSMAEVQSKSHSEVCWISYFTLNPDAVKTDMII